MTVRELAGRIGWQPLAIPSPDRVVCGAYAGDLLSWVMGHAGCDRVWATVLNHINVIAVAVAANVAAVVICENVDVPTELIETAQEQGVNLLRTEQEEGSLCVKVHSTLASGIPAVDGRSDTGSP